ncbi:DNA-binding response OmpR family regulator [Mycetocola sp. BIGb0189]|uniref:response regulator transcription factor n=1 Tax=Mycetocola sp. BIGb0189 TaxID=2940604 RepID=UPI002167A5B4|nr:response regulator transcription factor [Mycetocola sp. BIGb0189]MCS4277325.1 DNA-binding response OmpR family regulator [Mycetocola sp. BIGb0189]
MTTEPIRTAVVIEDDPDIRGLITTILTQAGFAVASSPSGIEGVELVRTERPSIVTLDIGLLDIDGLEVARRIRLFSDCYIVMLTAQADEVDVLFGLESGADDYLAKPFRPRELRARIEAMLRRPRGGAAEVPAAVPAAASTASPAVAAAPVVAEAPVSDRVSSHNGLILDRDTRTVECRGLTIALTRTEFDLLASLLASGRRVRSKADLVRELRSGEYVVSDYVSESEERSIEVHFGNLRRKLGDDVRQPEWVETVRGVGYRMAPARVDAV